ncbi:hypothetical protein, partial [Brevibacillus agri]|uniref:hypothetical protein n=1 Tax=Brevibacillus agri TaxID=51101 RepID=UPI002E1F2341|nr:hypothetical protein [Brevibacillus agri]
SFQTRPRSIAGLERSVKNIRLASILEMSKKGGTTFSDPLFHIAYSTSLSFACISSTVLTAPSTSN